MKIQLTPIASDKTSEINIKGEIIIYDGIPYDMGAIPDGAEVQAESPAIGTIKRIDEVIEITLIYFYNSLKCTYADRFPEALNVTDGIVKPTIGVQNV